MIDICNVTIQTDQHTLLKNLNYRFEKGMWYALLGRSGVGKTTLLRAIAGLLPPDFCIEGKIHFPANSYTWLSQQCDLLPQLTLLQNVTLYTRLHPNHISPNLEEVLSACALSHLQDRYPHQLSGGERQRVRLARTLMSQKDIIFMDEPFVALDVITSCELYALFRSLLKGKTVIMITHHPQEAYQLADRIAILKPDGLETLPTFSKDNLSAFWEDVVAKLR